MFYLAYVPVVKNILKFNFLADCSLRYAYAYAYYLCIFIYLYIYIYNMHTLLLYEGT